MNLLTKFSSAAAGHPWIKFYTEHSVKVRASVPERNKRILDVEVERCEESPLPFSPCKRQRGAQLTKSIPTEHEEDEFFFGYLRSLPHPQHPELDIQAAGKYDIIDALAAAISRIKLSEPMSRLCVPACPVSSKLKSSLCTAF